MKIILNLLFYSFMLNYVFSGELIWNKYGHYNFEKIFAVSKNEQIIFFNNKGIATTSLGTNASSECKGYLIYKNNADQGGFFICEATDADGDKVFTEFKPSRGEKDSYGLQQFKVIAGTGKWTELVGESCIGAFSQITRMDKDFKNASFIWSGKCDVADKTLDRVKNYKRPL
tara:strand:+ start:550 stop:1065 length:516 start_codon:yes stop_codon:yes gene_type:complete